MEILWWVTLIGSVLSGVLGVFQVLGVRSGRRVERPGNEGIPAGMLVLAVSGTVTAAGYLLGRPVTAAVPLFAVPLALVVISRARRRAEYAASER